jgi:2-keto-3-deoxy-L-rhamnonate aldolase RhmA
MEEWMEKLNEDTTMILQIESKEAINNIDQLISIEGVDATMVGPNDLSISLHDPLGPHKKPCIGHALTLGTTLPLSLANTLRTL